MSSIGDYMGRERVGEYTMGQPVWVLAHGRWYAGTVAHLGYCRVTVAYTLASGEHRTKTVRIDLKPTKVGAWSKPMTEPAIKPRQEDETALP